MVKSVIFMLIICLMGVASFFPAFAKDPLFTASPAMELAEGLWELAPRANTGKNDEASTFQCGVQPLTISIDVTTKRYKSRFSVDDDWRGANIIQSGEGFITIKYDKEDRLMETGELHIWHMIFTGPDEFVWVRDDWMDGEEIRGGTQPRRRCRQAIA